jgi:Ca-activated chloride channel family protein
MRFGHVLGLILMVGGLTVVVQAQRPSPAGGGRSGSSREETIAIATTEVLLPVTVRDEDGQLVSDLTADQFRVFEDGIEQPISSFALRRLPVHVVMLIDTSSSVVPELEDFKASAWRFMSRLDAEDRISLIRFDDRVELVQDWTSNRNTLRRALNRLTTGLFTRFNDALFLAAREQLGKIDGRKAIIVLTDGIDSGRGSIVFEQAFRAIVEEEVPVYVLSKTRIQSHYERDQLRFYEQAAGASINRLRIDGIRLTLDALDSSERRLRQLADETGGRLYLPDRFDQLDAVYQQVADELRSQYLIFYTPTEPVRDGRYRAIKVQLRKPRLHATTRFGYYAR